MRNCAWRTPAELKRYKANCKKESVMKVSLKWLNEYVEVPTDTKALCDKLDAEREKRDELLAALRRTDRDIARWQSLLRDLGADA